MLRVALAMSSVLLVGLVAGCGGGGDSASPEPGPGHVHALARPSAGGTVFIATHTGLFRLEDNETSAQRVGDRHQDVMGFTIAGPSRFLSSGHPDLRDDLPPLLGLVESRDGGRTWHPLSLLGKADFHLLRVAAGRIYGYDATGGRLLVSRDDGRTWITRRTPGKLVDLVVDPANGDRLVAATPTSLSVSDDGGRRWKALAGSPGLMAWPAAAGLVLVDGRGEVRRSIDGARTWTSVGGIGRAPVALTAANDRELYVATHEGPIMHSTDGGSSWRVRLPADAIAAG